jgi:hypothetical protein
MAACGTGFINGYHRQRPPADQLEVVKLRRRQLGHYPAYGGGELGRHSSRSIPCRQGRGFGPIDYAIGVGTFVPNNAVIMHADVVELMSEQMKQRGIKHTTSECTLRGFTCASANVDPKTATPAEIAKIRTIQTGYQVDGITGGLTVKEQNKNPK